ncbi:BspA family leucine-rich repeat surface protein [Mycoplasma yeatsii]|uniref:BspA family leucine-rich repeat surface protein n=1 Tax=Mycoplasma yeatsii TaxID=51365 RepID=UPI0005B238BB|nr:BspA family leucine-rich repeat surface protein [Mycoplasma yeatsii]AJM71825.1 PARCEL domain-containing protein [Mycoplasma yeatsii GM274B]
MKKFLKIMCLASLSILSAGSIFGIVYHQHNSNIVKREDKLVNDKDYHKDEAENDSHDNSDSNDEIDKDDEKDDEKLMIDDKPESQNIIYDTKIDEKEKQKAIARKEFEDILNNSNKSDKDIIESLVNDTKQELTISYKRATYNKDKTICKAIGFFKNDKGEIQIEQMPVTVKEVPAELPWQINSLQEAFSYNRNVKIKNLEKWNLQYVRNLKEIFYSAYDFNQDISNWDTSNVTDMSGMFWRADSFNHPIGRWNVSNVVDMNGMFYDNKNFNQPLNSWNVSNVTNMSEMFSNAEKFNQELSNWDVSKVTNMEGMFSYTDSFNKDISAWCLSNLNSTANMFNSAKAFNNDGVPLITRKVRKPNGQVVTTWDVSYVKNMEKMFYGASAFCQNISNWDVWNASTVEFVNSKSGNWFNPNWTNNLPKKIRDRYYGREDRIVY